jgi:MFS family permease
VWAPATRRLTTGLVLTVTLVAFESLAISAVMPTVEDDLGDVSLYGWVFSGFFLGQLLGIVLAGQAADRRAIGVPFATGLVLFVTGLVVGGVAPSMAALVVGRVVQGIGAGVIPAVAYTSVGRAYVPAVRPRVFAVFSTAWVVPGLIGPAAATALADALSWRAVFLALIPLVLVAAALTMPALAGLPAPPPGPVADRSRLGLALALIAGTALVLGGLASGVPVLAAVLVVVGAPVASAAFVRLVPPGTTRFAPGLPAAVAVRGVLTFAFFGVDAFVPLALTDGRGEDAWVGGVALTVATLTWTGAAWVQQHVIHRAGPRRLVRLGFLLLALGIVGAIACLGGPPVALAIVLWGFAGFGMGLSYAPISVTVLATAEPGAEGRATSAMQLTDVLGVALGTGMTGVFVAVGEAADWTTRASLTGAFAVCVAVALLGSVFARRLPGQA